MFKTEITDSNKLYFLQQSTLENLTKKKYEIEDTGALLYLQHLLYESKEKQNIRSVVIDEAQDFSVFQFYALQRVLDTHLFTILGDLSQGIHAYRGIQNWNQVAELFQPRDCSIVTLKQSYRTTIEIMNLANQVIQQLPVSINILAEPIIRHGKEPELCGFSESNALIDSLLIKIQEVLSEGITSIALITKSKQDGKKLQKKLGKEQHKFSFQFLSGKVGWKSGTIPIIPSYTVKGLEFDAVIIVNLDEVCTLDETDIKLLYVAIVISHFH